MGACIPLSNDFLQYYLGSWTNNSLRDPANAPTDEDAAEQQADLDNMDIDFFDPMAAPTAKLNGPDSANNQDHAYTLTPTSTILSPDEYPLFKSTRSVTTRSTGRWPRRRATTTPTRSAADHAYKRLTRTVDLTGHTSGTLKFATSYDTEPDYDYMFVEAHTVGQDDWTTLPEENGNTSQALDPAAGSCADGWAAPDGQHPFLAHYMNPDTCAPTGTSGEWNATTGNSGGYQDWEIDLSRLRRQAGRGLDLLRDGSVRAGARRLRRRHRGADRRRVEREDVVRDRPRRLGGRWAAGRQRAERQQLDPERGR